ncbi:MAG: metallophosphoesterase [Melioribacteraceae bacterium]|nr:metallophosphoesterase [Melioribacteraceae bacterium]
MNKVIIIIAIFTSSIIFAQDSAKIAFGPYIQQMTTKSATICWSTEVSKPTLTDQNGKVKAITEYQQHSIQLARLDANTEYSYDVLNDGSDEGKGTFKTYPDEIAPFKFVVLGDTRSRHDVHSKIVNMIIKEDPLFVLNTGDMVGNGREISDWEAFFKVNDQLMRNTQYYPVLGNHEKDSPYYFDFFDLPNNERYYSFNVGDALFVVLDSEGEEVSEPNYISDENSNKFWKESFEEYFTTQKKWLENVLNINKEAGFVFVFQHHPLYSVKKTRVEDTNEYRKFWGDFFERHNVQVFMNGHDHHYHHAMKNGVHYITTAGGGAGLYEADTPQPETVKINKIEHFVYIDVNTDDAVLNVIDIDGNQIDKITVDRREKK